VLERQLTLIADIEVVKGLLTKTIDVINKTNYVSSTTKRPAESFIIILPVDQFPVSFVLSDACT
jgi:hypothetical protein